MSAPWMEVAAATAVFAVAFNAIYWASRWLSPRCFPTYASLDREKGEQGYWASSMTGIIHAVFVCTLSFAALVHEPLLITSDEFIRSTALSNLCLEMLMGYILQDTLLSLYFGSLWPGWQANIIHHSAVLVAFSIVTLGSYIHGLALLSVLCELSTPFVNARWMLDKAQMKTGNVYLVNGLMMLFLFFVMRVCVYVWAGLRGYQMRDGFFSIPVLSAWILISCYFAGLFLQLFWFIKILQGALKVISARSAAGGYDKLSGERETPGVTPDGGSTPPRDPEAAVVTHE